MTMSIRIKVRPPDTDNVAKVIVFDRAGKILLLRRRVDQRYPGQWDLPGGHLVDGEAWIDGARREVKEETNLDLLDLEEIFREGRRRYFKSTSFSGSLFADADLPEHDEFLWICPTKISQLKNIGDIYVRAIERAQK